MINPKPEDQSISYRYLRETPEALSLSNLVISDRETQSIYGPIGGFFNNFALNISSFPSRAVLSMLKNYEPSQQGIEYLLRCRTIELAIKNLVPKYPRLSQHIAFSYFHNIEDPLSETPINLIYPIVFFDEVILKYFSNVVHLGYDQTKKVFIRPRRFKYSSSEEDEYDEELMMEVLNFVIELYKYLRSLSISHADLCR